MTIDQSVTLNDSQRLFVIKTSGGVSCLGYDVCHEQTKHLANLMNEDAGIVVVQPPEEQLRGTLAGYAYYQRLVQQFSAHPVAKKTLFQPGTHHKVASVLERARNSNETMLRLFFGDPATGLDRCEEWDVVGYIGRSTGPMRVPLLMEPLWDNHRLESAAYGGAINCASIVRIIRVNDGKELYRAANYHLPTFEIECSDATPGYPFIVNKAGQLQARFKTEEQATAYVAFMQGHRLHEPFRTGYEAQRD